jgi:hypothetical protein
MHIAMPILAFGFLSPWLFAAGAAATSVPIIIHLLNKRKFRTIVWAAMDFLLAAQRRNARRLKFQRWLLLAVRCLALLVLAAAVGQLVLETTAVGAWLGSGQRGIVVVWDDSYSMGFQREGAEPAFENSRKLLIDWLGKLSSSDKVMLIQAHRGGINAANKPTPDHKGLQAQVKAAELSDAGTDLVGALDQAAETLKELKKAGTTTREVIVLTDCSNSSIHDPVRGIGGGGAENRVQGLEGDRLRKAMDAVKAVTTMNPKVWDLGTADQVNMAVTELQSQRPIVVAGTPSKFDVTVMNATMNPQIDKPLTILVDGVVQHTENLGKIDAGSVRQVVVDVTVPTAGRHLIEARLPTDQLPVDDVRRLMLNVQREIPVLMVDGDPPDNRHLGSTQYLAYAYTFPAQGKIGGVFTTKIITELELPTTALSPYAVVVMSDTTAPKSALVRENLQKYVEAGGLLMIFPGDNTNPREMNDLIGEGGTKLLPATMGQPVKLATAVEMKQGIAFAPQNFTHPVLQKFGEADSKGMEAGFRTVQTQQYIKLGVPGDGSSEVILRYAKADQTPGDPAVVMKQIGRGKVVLFASTADTEWNTFGAEPSFLPFIHELTYYAMAREATGLTLRVGDKINLPAETENPGSWTAPRGGRISVSAETIDGRSRLTSGALLAAGPYGTADGRPVVAVNPDAEEVDIRHVAAPQMAAALGIDTKDIGEAPRSLAPRAAMAEQKQAGSDLARNLLLGALGFFLLETVLARLFSVYR